MTTMRTLMPHAYSRAGLRLAISSGVLVSALSMAHPARALSDAERAGARAAADEGVTAFEEGQWSEAVDRFQRAEAIVHSPVHLLYIARAQIQLGKLVEAREALIKIANETVPPNAPGAVLEAKQEAEKELAPLEPRIPYVTTVVKGESSEPIVVTMDGEQIPPTLVGLPRPVNPGEHRFRAAAGDQVSEEKVITMAEGDGKETVELVLPPSTGRSAVTSSGGMEASMADTGAPSEAGSGLRLGGFIGLGVGFAGLGLGTAFTVIGAGKLSDADDEFEANRCGLGCPGEQARIQGMYDDADSARTIGAVGFVAGAVGLGAGITMLVLSSSDSSDPESARAPAVIPYVGAGNAGVVGRF